MNFVEESIHRQGYFKALVDVKNWFDQHSETLKCNKMYNKKGISLMLNAFLNNMDTFMKYADFTEFIVNTDKTKVVLGEQNE